MDKKKHLILFTFLLVLFIIYTILQYNYNNSFKSIKLLEVETNQIYVDNEPAIEFIVLFSANKKIPLDCGVQLVFDKNIGDIIGLYESGVSTGMIELDNNGIYSFKFTHISNILTKENIDIINKFAKNTQIEFYKVNKEIIKLSLE